MWEASLDPANVKRVVSFCFEVRYHIPDILMFSPRCSVVRISKVMFYGIFFPEDTE